MEEFMKRDPERYEAYKKARLETVVGKISTIPHTLVERTKIEFEVPLLEIDETMDYPLSASVRANEVIARIVREIRIKDKENLVRNIALKYQFEGDRREYVYVESPTKKFECIVDPQARAFKRRCRDIKRPRRELEQSEEEFLQEILRKI
jgi:hypothetical protein